MAVLGKLSLPWDSYLFHYFSQENNLLLLGMYCHQSAVPTIINQQLFIEPLLIKSILRGMCGPGSLTSGPDSAIPVGGGPGPPAPMSSPPSPSLKPPLQTPRPSQDFQLTLPIWPRATVPSLGSESFSLKSSNGCLLTHSGSSSPEVFPHDTIETPLAAPLFHSSLVCFFL